MYVHVPLLQVRRRGGGRARGERRQRGRKLGGFRDNHENEKERACKLGIK